MRKKYFVTLSQDERAQLRSLLRKGHALARRIARAQIVLLADQGQGDAAIATNMHVGALTVHRMRKRYAEEGLAAVLGERPRPGGQPKLDGKQEALWSR